MSRLHEYTITLQWSGNKGLGTSSYTSYERDYTINADSKMTIEGSSDPTFRGDPKRYNPEELLLASIASCHMLWFLHLCSNNEIVITEYSDRPIGIMTESDDGSGRFNAVELRPNIVFDKHYDTTLINALHAEANKKCFIANSVNFTISHTPTCIFP